MLILPKDKNPGCLVGVMVRFFILSTLVFLLLNLLIVWFLDYLMEKSIGNHQNIRKIQQSRF